MDPSIPNQPTPPITTETQTLVAGPVQSTPNTSSGKTKYILIGVIVLLFLLALGSGTYYLAVVKQQPALQKSVQIPINSNAQATPKPTPEIKNIIASPAELGDLGLIKQTADGNNTDATYYQVGTIPVGQYKGYKRIIAVIQPLGPGGPDTEIFATNDDKQYVLNGNPQAVTKYPETDFNNPYFLVNKQKISAIADLTDHPQTITLNNSFVLNRNNVSTEYKDTGKDANGNSYSTNVLITDFSTYQNLKSDNQNFTYWYKPYQPSPLVNNQSGPLKTDALTRDKYLAGKTEVIVVDSQGLAYSYNLTTPERLAVYNEQLAKYNQDIAKSNYGTTYPTVQPNLGFSNGDIKTDQNIYSSYNSAFIGICGSEQNTYLVKNITDSDLTKIGTLNAIDIYALSDKNNPLNTTAYGLKIVDYFSTGNTFQDNNKANPPTSDTYLAKNPLLFMKDPWGRLVVLSEYDYKLPGGCGKPVIYLYPTKPTKVSVSFVSLIQFDTDMPTYHNGWNVLANPNGLLTDLQPQYTNCKTIDTTKSGLEYAKSACQENAYPYLYWSGRSLDHPYQTEDLGWIVEKNNLRTFMDNKLTEIGLNQKEKTDMLSYWLPEMLNKNTPYYKISFLQTEQMNQLAPMNISPKPDTLYRIFLDWLPLSAKPPFKFVPQNLNKLQRTGFTVVEWGGLKQ
jgi:hypothetical protein